MAVRHEPQLTEYPTYGIKPELGVLPVRNRILCGSKSVESIKRLRRWFQAPSRLNFDINRCR